MQPYKLFQWSFLSIGIYFLFLENGYAQFTSTFQSAESVGKGRWEVTGLYSSLSSGYDGESNGVLNDFGFMAGVGLSANTEIRARFDRLAYKEGDGDGLNNLFIGPKFSSKSGKFAFYLPIGIMFEKNSGENWMTEPSLIFSIPLGQVIQVNVTPSYLIPLGEDIGFSDGLLKLNLGLGIKTKGDWIFRPEIGLQYWVESIGDGHLLNLGIGVSKRIGGS